MDIWSKRVPGSRTSKSNVPKACCIRCMRNVEEIHVALSESNQVKYER